MLIGRARLVQRREAGPVLKFCLAAVVRQRSAATVRAEAQEVFVNALVKSDNIEAALYQAGSTNAALERWLSKPKFVADIDFRKDEAAKSASLTAEFIRARTWESLMGIRNLGRQNARILEVVYKDLCTSGLSKLLGDGDVSFVVQARVGSADAPLPIEGEVADKEDEVAPQAD